MGTISDKLTYLNTTKGKIKDSINLTGANIGNNDTFRSYSAKLRDGLVSAINDGGATIYNNFPKTTGSGSSVTLNNTYQAPMKVGLKGNTYQGSDPTPDSPKKIEVVTGYNEVEVVGKNLFDINSATSIYINNSGEEGSNNDYKTTDYISTLPNTNYYFSTTQKSGQTSKQIYIAYYNSSKTFISRSSYNLLVSSFTTPANCYYIRAGVYSKGQENTQLELGSTATEYEEFKGQSYEVNLGKNLFDKNNANVLDATINSSTKIIESSNQYKILYLQCKPNTTYTISKIQSNYLSFGFTDTLPTLNVEVKNYISLTSGDTTKITNTSLSTSKYMIARYWRSTDTLTSQEIIDTIQIEEGSDKTSYSAYKTPIEMCKINDYKDEIRRSTGKNLFNKDNANQIMENINIHSTTGVVQNVTDNHSIIVPCKPNTTYVISKISTSKFNIGSSPTYPNIGDTLNNLQAVTTATTATITTGNNDKYIMAWVYTPADTVTFQQILDSIQIEKNTQATDLEPYGVGVWYKYGKIGKVVLDGSEDETYVKVDLNCVNGFNQFNYTKYMLLPNAYNYGSLCMSNYFEYYKEASTGNKTKSGIRIRSTNPFLVLSINDTLAPDISTLKTWLASHNTIVYYVLENSTVTTLDTELQTQLNALEQANSYSPQTNITAEYVSGNQPFIINASALLDEE